MQGMAETLCWATEPLVSIVPDAQLLPRFFFIPEACLAPFLYIPTFAPASLSQVFTTISYVYLTFIGPALGLTLLDTTQAMSCHQRSRRDRAGHRCLQSSIR